MNLSDIPKAECRHCKSLFIKRSRLHSLCSWRCLFAEQKIKEAADRAETKRRKEDAKPRSKWLKEAQAAVNKWVRLRDSGQPCISCGKAPNIGASDAGHYLSVGSNPALRFEPLNIHRQCVACNQYRHGNAIKYRLGLIDRIGLERVEWLEGPHEPKKYTIPDLKQIIALYRAKAKELEAA